jgi:hypothetical protein
MPTFAQLRERYPNATLGFLAANASDGLPAALAPRKPDVTPAKMKGATPGKSKGKRASRVPLVRNGGAWSEAKYWGTLRSHLRRAFRFWKPAVAALHAARIASKGPRGRKWLFLCADCKKLFPRKGVQIDHVEPCGTLTSFDHLPDFIRRLTPEDPNAYAVRCTACHQKKTNAERSTGAGRECRKPAVPSIPAAP